MEDLVPLDLGLPNRRRKRLNRMGMLLLQKRLNETHLNNNNNCVYKCDMCLQHSFFEYLFNLYVSYV